VKPPGITPPLAPNEPSEEERSCGMEFYLSPTPGVGGRLREEMEDFRVDEISRYPMPEASGRYVVMRVRAVDVEQNTLLARMGGALGLPPGSIGYAGTKDRRAITTQLLSFPWPRPGLPSLQLSGVTVLEAYRARDPVGLGALYGNRFWLCLRDLRGEAEVLEARIRAIEQDLRSAGGFPNFFGPQRFGEARPVTHWVGRALVHGSVEQAVETYLSWLPERAEAGSEPFRRAFGQTRDVAAALRSFPAAFTFERTLLDRLQRGRDASAAFHALPRGLRTLFVHAYQSYLFNRLLSRRFRAGLPLGRPVPGDRVQRLAPDGLDAGLPTLPVTPDNMGEMERFVASGRARVAGPLVGTDTPGPVGEPGELLERLLEEEGVQRRDFRLPEVPELRSRGTFRAFLAPLPLSLFPGGSPRTGPGPEGTRTLDLSFTLEKGQYATVLLREFRKTSRE
jgi:tRNA pseudouridine13 synthase